MSKNSCCHTGTGRESTNRTQDFRNPKQQANCRIIKIHSCRWIQRNSSKEFQGEKKCGMYMDSQAKCLNNKKLLNFLSFTFVKEFCALLLCADTDWEDEDQIHFAVQMLKLKTLILILLSSLTFPVYRLAWILSGNTVLVSTISEKTDTEIKSRCMLSDL